MAGAGWVGLFETKEPLSALGLGRPAHLNAAPEARQEHADVLHEDGIEPAGQVGNPTLRAHVMVGRGGGEEGDLGPAREEGEAASHSW